MRTRGKVDRNHGEIVKALRAAGIAVKSTAAIGSGFPDLICALRGVTCQLEVKDGSKPVYERRLTAQEAEYIATWPGPVFVVTSPEEAVRKVVEAARPVQSEVRG